MTAPISVLLSHDNTNGTAFEFRTVKPAVQEFVDLIGCTYMAAIPGTDWAVYYDEDNGGSRNHAAIRLLAGLSNGHSFDLNGRCMFVGHANGIEADVPDHLIDLALMQLPYQKDLRVCLFRHRKHLFVYDEQGKAIKDLLTAVTRHRTARDLDPIEAYFGITPSAWTELRVEIMDDWSIQLHDHRNDRSYG